MAETPRVSERDIEIPSILLPCVVCNRTFRPEALAKHVKVCEKSGVKKRKVFDSSKQRIQGTDLAEFLPVLPIIKKPEKSPVRKTQSKWKEKHTELVRTIQAARVVPGGDAPTPVKPSDHEKCPYCERFFGPKAFDRHLDFCKEQRVRVQPKSPASLQAKERLEARTKYRAPLLSKSRRLLTKEKYSPHSKTRDPSPASFKTSSSPNITVSPPNNARNTKEPANLSSSNFTRGTSFRGRLPSPNKKTSPSPRSTAKSNVSSNSTTPTSGKNKGLDENKQDLFSGSCTVTSIHPHENNSSPKITTSSRKNSTRPRPCFSSFPCGHNIKLNNLDINLEVPDITVIPCILYDKDRRSKFSLPSDESNCSIVLNKTYTKGSAEHISDLINDEIEIKKATCSNSLNALNTVKFNNFDLFNESEAIVSQIYNSLENSFIFVENDSDVDEGLLQKIDIGDNIGLFCVVESENASKMCNSLDSSCIIVENDSDMDDELLKNVDKGDNKVFFCDVESNQLITNKIQCESNDIVLNKNGTSIRRNSSAESPAAKQNLYECSQDYVENNTKENYSDIDNDSITNIDTDYISSCDKESNQLKANKIKLVSDDNLLNQNGASLKERNSSAECQVFTSSPVAKQDSQQNMYEYSKDSIKNTSTENHSDIDRDSFTNIDAGYINYFSYGTESNQIETNVMNHETDDNVLNQNGPSLEGRNKVYTSRPVAKQNPEKKLFNLKDEIESESCIIFSALDNLLNDQQNNLSVIYTSKRKTNYNPCKKRSRLSRKRQFEIKNKVEYLFGNCNQHCFDKRNSSNYITVNVKEKPENEIATTAKYDSVVLLVDESEDKYLKKQNNVSTDLESNTIECKIVPNEANNQVFCPVQFKDSETNDQNQALIQIKNQSIQLINKDEDEVQNNCVSKRDQNISFRKGVKDNCKTIKMYNEKQDNLPNNCSYNIGLIYEDTNLDFNEKCSVETDSNTDKFDNNYVCENNEKIFPKINLTLEDLSTRKNESKIVDPDINIKHVTYLIQKGNNKSCLNPIGEHISDGNVQGTNYFEDSKFNKSKNNCENNDHQYECHTEENVYQESQCWGQCSINESSAEGFIQVDYQTTYIEQYHSINSRTIQSHSTFMDHRRNSKPFQEKKLILPMIKQNVNNKTAEWNQSKPKFTIDKNKSKIPQLCSKLVKADIPPKIVHLPPIPQNPTPISKTTKNTMSVKHLPPISRKNQQNNLRAKQASNNRPRSDEETLNAEQELLKSISDYENLFKSDSPVISTSLESLKLFPSLGCGKRHEELDSNDKEKNYSRLEEKKSELDSAYNSLNRKSPLNEGMNADPGTRSSSESDSSAPSLQNSAARFCHECGNRYPVREAKFCCNCGIRRLVL